MNNNEENNGGILRKIQIALLIFSTISFIYQLATWDQKTPEQRYSFVLQGVGVLVFIAVVTLAASIAGLAVR